MSLPSRPIHAGILQTLPFLPTTFSLVVSAPRAVPVPQQESWSFSRAGRCGVPPHRGDCFPRHHLTLEGDIGSSNLFPLE